MKPFFLSIAACLLLLAGGCNRCRYCECNLPNNKPTTKNSMEKCSRGSNAGNELDEWEREVKKKNGYYACADH